jgi:hypothetical protein
MQSPLVRIAVELRYLLQIVVSFVCCLTVDIMFFCFVYVVSKSTENLSLLNVYRRGATRLSSNGLNFSV